jgi:hypothetical protein
MSAPAAARGGVAGSASSASRTARRAARRGPAFAAVPYGPRRALARAPDPPVCETTVAFVTRRGNPHGIKDWADLTRPGLQVRRRSPRRSCRRAQGGLHTGCQRLHAAWPRAARTRGDRRPRTPRCCVAQVVLANPKTAGVARWIFLALWGHKMRKGDEAAMDYVTKAGGRGGGVGGRARGRGARGSVPMQAALLAPRAARAQALAARCCA